MRMTAGDCESCPTRTWWIGPSEKAMTFVRPSYEAGVTSITRSWMSPLESTEYLCTWVETAESATTVSLNAPPLLP